MKTIELYGSNNIEITTRMFSRPKVGDAFELIPMMNSPAHGDHYI